MFDASQYAFFGRNSMDKVDLGCLEEDVVVDDTSNTFATGVVDDEYHLFDREEV